jgi:hypothetical protein
MLDRMAGDAATTGGGPVSGDHDPWILAEIGRRILDAAVCGTGRITLPYVRTAEARTIDQLAAAVQDAAIAAGQQITWHEHPSGWLGELTPVDPAGVW